MRGGATFRPPETAGMPEDLTPNTPEYLSWLVDHAVRATDWPTAIKALQKLLRLRASTDQRNFEQRLATCLTQDALRRHAQANKIWDGLGILRRKQTSASDEIILDELFWNPILFDEQDITSTARPHAGVDTWIPIEQFQIFCRRCGRYWSVFSRYERYHCERCDGVRFRVHLPQLKLQSHLALPSACFVCGQSFDPAHTSSTKAIKPFIFTPRDRQPIVTCTHCAAGIQEKMNAEIERSRSWHEQALAAARTDLEKACELLAFAEQELLASAAIDSTSPTTDSALGNVRTAMRETGAKTNSRALAGFLDRRAFGRKRWWKFWRG